MEKTRCLTTPVVVGGGWIVVICDDNSRCPTIKHPGTHGYIGRNTTKVHDPIHVLGKK
jgi:hypothetical protein